MTPALTGARVVLGIGELAIAGREAGIIITHALGSCVGVAVYDSSCGIGGLLHAQLPSPGQNPDPDLVARHPGRYVDLGLTLLLREVERAGARRPRLRVTIAGGASNPATPGDLFQVGKRNLVAVRKHLWQAGLLIAGEDVGSDRPRTMFLDLADGRSHICSGDQRHVL
jgi:chemotaxis protein CheD